MRTTRHDLSLSTRTAIADLLAAPLAAAIDLGLGAKQAHWNVRGRQFAALHALFDQVAATAHAWADELAERIVALGAIADGTLATVAGRSPLPAYPTAATSGDDHLAALSDRLASLGSVLRAGIDIATQLGDAVTADLCTALAAAADKQLWMVEAHLS